MRGLTWFVPYEGTSLACGQKEGVEGVEGVV